MRAGLERITSASVEPKRVSSNQFRKLKTTDRTVSVIHLYVGKRGGDYGSAIHVLTRRLSRTLS